MPTCTVLPARDDVGKTNKSSHIIHGKVNKSEKKKKKTRCNKFANTNIQQEKNKITSNKFANASIYRHRYYSTK